MKYEVDVISALFYRDNMTPIEDLRKYFVVFDIEAEYKLSLGPFDSYAECDAVIGLDVLGQTIRSKIGYIVFSRDTLLYKGVELTAGQMVLVAEQSRQMRTLRTDADNDGDNF